ncbi:MAG: DUF222 domain-containing protein [Actinomycetota bacterium]|nr:DUF222 domain-containing protein [Actinomycetota bacterium]
MIGIQESTTSPIGNSDPVLQIRMGIAVLAGENRDGWTGTAMSERVTEMLEIRESLDAEILRLVGLWDRDRAWEIDGSLSPRAWLTYRTPIADGEAQRLVKTARIVDRHDTVSEALAEGEITTPHVEAIGRVMSKDRLALLAEHQEVLVNQAKKLPVADFTMVMRRWASLADDQLSKDTFVRKWDRRHLHASTSLDGWVSGDFYLDPVAGGALLNALDHIAPPDPHDAPDGPRPLSQRRADALADLVSWYINGDSPGGNPPNVNGVIDVASLLGEIPEIAAARCDLDGIGPVTRTVLDQLCCDARFTRFIMAGPSQILDMGRATRLATPGQRQAVAIRDQHCRFPSCRRKPQWCDIHHIAGWMASLGETNTNNLILLCRRHHTLVHNTKWTIERTPNEDFKFNHPARAP